MVKLKSLNKISLHNMTVLYGLAGSGKSTFINGLKGKVLIIDTDRGLASVDDTLDATVAECETFEDVLDALEYAGDFDSIVIDHFTNVQELCYNKVLKDSGATKMLINHYGEASKMLKSLVDRLVGLAYGGKNILVLVQEKNINIEDTIAEEVPQQIVPNLMDSVRSYLVASARIIGHTEKATQTKIVKGKKMTREVYQVRLAGNPVYTLKVTRKAKLPIPHVLIDADWETLVGLVDGTTQAKLGKEKETKGDTE